MNRFYLSIFFICINFFAKAQQYRFTHYSREEGLQNELIKSIAQDTLGFVWLATDDGLIRFEGSFFRQYKQNLPSHYVKSLIKRRNGQLLAATDLGIVEVISQADKVIFKDFLKGSSDLKDSLVWYPKLMYEDEKNRLWITDSQTLFCYENGVFRRYYFDKKNYPNSYHRSFSLTEDGNGNLLAFSETGFAFIYQEKTDKFKEINLKFPLESVSHAIQADKGIILLGTINGVIELVFDNFGNLVSQKNLMPNIRISYLNEFSPNNFYAASWADGLFILKRNNESYKIEKFSQVVQHDINYVYKDKENTWLATDNGVVLVQEETFNRIFEDQTKREIQHLSTSTDGKTYFTDGISVFLAIPENKSFAVSKIYQITHTFITKLLAQDQGVWVGNNLGELVLITLDKKQQNFDLKPFGKDILALEGDNNENVWISQNENNSLIKITSEGKMIFYGKEKGVSGKINVIRKAPNGDIYAGGNQDDNYFFKYNPEKDEFQNLSQKVYFEHNLPLSVSDLVIENDKTVWIATTFGLLQYKNNQITRTELGSMTDNAIKALAIDQNNNLWFASSHGLIKYLANTTIIFDESQGLPSKVVNFRCITVDKNNGIWAGTVGGIGYSKNIDPYKITPTPILVSIESNNEQILDKITQKIFSSEFDNKSYIKIQAVSIAYPARFMRYQMRLLGKKDEWIDLDKGEILLSGLEVGKYTLEIRAKQSGNYIWSSPMAYSFAIYQVWYSTWWAWLIFILIISVFVFAIIKFNNRRLLHEKHELEALIRERTYELQEQQSETLAQTAALQENNEKLNQKNDQLEQVNKELQSTLKRLQVMQGKLIQSEKMASMGQLTAGIAHEINNPINFIATGVETLETLIFDLNQVLDLYANIDKASSEQIVILLKEIKELKTKIVYEDVQQDIQQLLVDIQIGIKRTVDTIRSLRSLSRADSGEMRPVDLHENIESTLIILRSQYRDRIDIIKDYGQIPLINCASAAINQVLMNLLANAIQAIKDKGKIIISTKDIGDEVRISIKDSGKGMSKEIQKRIFEPFFTTKADGEGTGLGLSITKDIIRSHQGKIEVQSEEGEGTEFILFLPKIKK